MIFLPAFVQLASSLRRTLVLHTILQHFSQVQAIFYRKDKVPGSVIKTR